MENQYEDQGEILFSKGQRLLYTELSINPSLLLPNAKHLVGHISNTPHSHPLLYFLTLTTQGWEGFLLLLLLLQYLGNNR